MRKYLKRITSIFLIPLTRLYLRKERKFTHGNIEIVVSPGVFHPGLFYSTKFLLGYLSRQNLHQTSFLELGCGTGVISVMASKAGAAVTASDLSKRALKNAEINSQRNKTPVAFIHSDVFDNFPVSTFDWIIINPPYYAATPTTEEELAWHCGVDFDYFKKLFGSLTHHIHPLSKVIMVLTKGCDLQAIFSIANEEGFSFTLIEEKKVFFDEKDFIYQIKKI